MNWILQEEKNPPKVIGYKWKVCDDRAQIEIERFYQMSRAQKQFGVRILAEDSREYTQGMGDFKYFYQFDREIPEG